MKMLFFKFKNALNGWNSALKWACVYHFCNFFRFAVLRVIACITRGTDNGMRCLFSEKQVSVARCQPLKLFSNVFIQVSISLLATVTLVLSWTKHFSIESWVESRWRIPVLCSWKGLERFYFTLFPLVSDIKANAKQNAPGTGVRGSKHGNFLWWNHSRWIFSASKLPLCMIFIYPSFGINV